MKLNLVVASGVHEGKAIPVPGPRFVIGRDPECQLRPASQSVSKQHCALVIRGTTAFVQDFGSTNGTFVNDEQLEPNSEREVKNGDRLKLGPLDFHIKFVIGPSDSTPLPDALKSVGKPGSSAAQKPAPQKSTPAAAAQKSAPPAAPKPVPVPAAKSDDDGDTAAAMLLGMGDEDPPGSEPRVPDGSTVFDMAAAQATAEGAKPDDKKDKKGVPTREDTSNAASDILRKYMRRPR